MSLPRPDSTLGGGQASPHALPLRCPGRSDMEALKRELQVLSEQYSQKCLEIGALTRQAEEREHTLRCCQQEGQELLRHNQVSLARRVGARAPRGPALTVLPLQELHARLSEEIDRLRGFVASQGTGSGCGRGERSSCELEVSACWRARQPGWSSGPGCGEGACGAGPQRGDASTARRGTRHVPGCSQSPARPPTQALPPPAV